MSDGTKNALGSTVAVALVVLVVFGMVVLSVKGCGLYKSWHRGQIRQDAENGVKVTAINIRKAQQQAKITAANDANVQALADQRIIEAKGIKKAQDIISATLTPLYLQHEAIKAQLAMANGTNHTVVYVPSERMGVPLVQTVP